MSWAKQSADASVAGLERMGGGEGRDAGGSGGGAA